MQFNINIKSKKGQEGACDIHSSLDICRINNFPYGQGKPCVFVIDYEHKGMDNSLGTEKSSMMSGLQKEKWENIESWSAH